MVPTLIEPPSVKLISPVTFISPVIDKVDPSKVIFDSTVASSKSL